MTNRELCDRAKEFANNSTCYLKGFWGQYLSASEYSRVLAMYPVNAKYGNEGYIGTEVFPFDCVCFVKALLGGASVNKRLTYKEMSANPLGDCTCEKYYNSLYDCVEPERAPAGYGLATLSHSAISLGSGCWVDCNFSGSQNGVVIHTGGIPSYFKAGKIPSIEYESETDESETDESGILHAFADYLIELYLGNTK